MAIPLTLKIIIGIILVLIVFLFVTPKRKGKYILYAIILFVGVGVWQGLKEYNRTNKDPEKTPAKYEVAANDLLKEFENGDSIELNKKYGDQIIAINGIVKEIKKDSSNFTIMLGDTCVK